MDFCRVCFKPLQENILTIGKRELILCPHCFYKLNPQLRKIDFSLDKALVLYKYHGEFQNLLFRFKSLGDYELKDIFLYYFLPYLRLKFKNYWMVAAPSYSEREKKRGFSHVKEIFSSLGLRQLDLFIKTKDIKQADLGREERSKIGDCILLREKVSLKNYKILLVDDVLTTGSTIRACYSLLRELGARKIKVLVAASDAPS